jgi:hypothetical protein
MNRPNRAIQRLLAIAAVLLLCASGRGADLTLLNGDVNLVISSATAGQQPDPVTNETAQLNWTTLVADPIKKIVASTNQGSPHFTLTLRAIGVNSGHGTALGQIAVTPVPADLIGSIPADITAGDPGQCSLRYTASATAANGTGTDSHTVTFTILDQ